jgi:4-alpha-glucanotransferase
MGRAPLALARRARRRGILTDYRDARGVRRPASARTLHQLLAALGALARGPAGGPSARKERGPGDRPPPTIEVVVRPARPTDVARLRLPPSHRPWSSARLRVDGPRRWVSLRIDARGRLKVPGSIPPGVHTVRLGSPGRHREVTIIFGPRRLPPPSSRREWGLFVPVYALRDRSTWGCGDLRSFEAVGRWAAAYGATVLATLPLLPAFLDRPFEPSPYRPVSRRFWNEVYLDVSRTPEFRRSTAVRRWVRTPAFRRRVRELERREYVDFRGVARLKRSVLERLWAEFSRAPVARRRAFARFVAGTDGLVEYARFRAGRGRARRRDEAYHRFAQWLTDEQLRGVARRLGRRGVVLALDLPLGTHPNGFDVHRTPDVYVRGVRVGSPPDPGVPAGQDWNFPPLHPDRLRAAGYRPFAEALAHALSVGGIVRIDHVLGLHRLFWIPPGAPPRRGAYVRSRAEELYAVLQAEAARAGARVVGEDLGTVPVGLRSELRRRGILAVYVAALEWDGPRTPRPIPAACVVSLNTHDHLPFAAWWTRRRRPGAPRPGRGDARPSTVEAAFRAATLTLAASPASVLLVNLEDLWGERRPQNVPGRGGRQFSRRCRGDLATLRADARSAELLSTIDAVRRGRYARWNRPDGPVRAGRRPGPGPNRPPPPPSVTSTSTSSTRGPTTASTRSSGRIRPVPTRRTGPGSRSGRRTRTA